MSKDCCSKKPFFFCAKEAKMHHSSLFTAVLVLYSVLFKRKKLLI